MKISQLMIEENTNKAFCVTKNDKDELRLWFRLEIPRSDALRVCSRMSSIKQFISDYGDQDCELLENGRVHIPAFKEGREKYSKAKKIDCDRWGCE